MTVNYLVKWVLRICRLPRSCLRWWKKGMAWPWILILTGLATGIIAALTRWISESNVPPGGP